MKISNRHLLHKSPKIKCSNRPLVTYLKDINGAYFLFLNGTIISAPVLEDTISELSYSQTFQIHGCDDWLVTHLGGAIHDTLNAVGDLGEKLVESLGEAAFIVLLAPTLPS